MATKKDEPPAGDEHKQGLFDSALAGTVKESAQQIWLAGLGAFAKAQEEGGRVFEALVKEGANLQKKTQTAAEESLSRMSSMAGEVQARAGQRWDKLETLFEDRTARAMGRLGVPTRKDLEALAARIDALQAKVAALARTPVARKAAAPKRAPAAGGAPKRTPRKRAG
jgi:poly(hydroxyalkanoate) granule-associated protein